MAGPHKPVRLAADAEVKATPGMLYTAELSATANASAELRESDGGALIWPTLRVLANDSRIVHFPGGLAFSSLYVDNITGAGAEVGLLYD